MKIRETEIEGVWILEPRIHTDHRGFFIETFHKKRLESLGLPHEFKQDNHSFSKERGVLRGLHYQLNPKAQTKLVRVATGSIYDVVVDLRRDSTTYGHWLGFVLDSESNRQLLVPKGMAHGFCTLSPDTTVLYKVDECYDPTLDRGIRWDDEKLSIDWPVASPILSDKDSTLPFLEQAEFDFSIKG
ncbi:dTDP-4-dehydrorhamnose 3,5-epimerase [Rossellomorea sp. YZS02]|uniref:dTDP-4-dehydrorhamnose 3,5-epimerase n=1 Tax=Rossellomorea sp. YZS02 TaxID=3097358 RepID=UPI002A129E43|nr:dTDP-4-dehydrorhamnose 3,5-epimerase [Rossellomorea sp. YZS02]MDX8345777.1 dTDP-4-dehydrorhamnose 3,5-epimerase [Rossellomorea sp. YZS02]